MSKLQRECWLNVENLQMQIQNLETKVQSLRLSRRILMNVLELTEKEKKLTIKELRDNSDKLRKENRRYARIIMQQNQRIFSLTEEIKKLRCNSIIHNNNTSGNV